MSERKLHSPPSALICVRLPGPAPAAVASAVASAVAGAAPPRAGGDDA